MEFCLSCETNAVVICKTQIKVGRETFETSAESCTKCKKVFITPQLQREIDRWALQFTKSIVELQPYFSSDLAEKIDLYSKKFILSKSELMKAFTTFYIAEMAQTKSFKRIREAVLRKAQAKYKGERAKICVPIKYLLFKKIGAYAEFWNLGYDANVMEEAVQFCVAVLDNHFGEVEDANRNRLVKFVEQHAMAS